MLDNYKDKLTLLTAIRNSDNAAFEHLYKAYYMLISKYVKKNNGTVTMRGIFFKKWCLRFTKNWGVTLILNWL